MFIEIEKMILRVILKYKRPKLVRIVGVTLQDIKTFNKATVSKAV